MTEWEEAYCDPLVQQGFFADLVRQTMAVDLSDLMEPTPPRKPRTKRAKSTETEDGSIVAIVDKAVLLAMVDQLESEAAVQEERKQQVWAIAHEENVLAWVEALSQWLRVVTTHQTSTQLCRSLGMPRVGVWLGVLLGEFEGSACSHFLSQAGLAPFCG